MNISKINAVNPNFEGYAKVRIPMNNGSTKVLEVVSDEVVKNGKIVGHKITNITGKVMRKGKVVEEMKGFFNKRGFSDNRLVTIAVEIGKDAKEPDTVMDKLMSAVYHPTIDLNA